jgi:hypothetical protein
MRPTGLAAAKIIHAWGGETELLFVSGQQMIAFFFAAAPSVVRRGDQ